MAQEVLHHTHKRTRSSSSSGGGHIQAWAMLQMLPKTPGLCLFLNPKVLHNYVAYFSLCDLPTSSLTVAIMYSWSWNAPTEEHMRWTLLRHKIALENPSRTQWRSARDNNIVTCCKETITSFVECIVLKPSFKKPRRSQTLVVCLLQGHGCMQGIIWQRPSPVHRCSRCRMHSPFWDGHPDCWRWQSVA